MEPSADPEITSLVLLYKAFVQQRFKLESEIKLRYISSNFYKYNVNWRYFLELLPKLKQIKISYLSLSRLLKKVDEEGRQSAEASALQRLISTNFIEMNNLSDKILSNLNNFEIQKHELNASKYNLKEKQAKLEQLRSLYQVNLRSLKNYDWKKAQVESQNFSISSLKEKILNIRVTIKDLSLKNNHPKPIYLQDMNTVKNYQKLSKNHLLLRSKMMLKQDIHELLESAKQTYESQIHCFKLEKRRIQKIYHQDTQKNEKKNSDVMQTRPCTISKDNFQDEIEEYFKCISPINLHPGLNTSEFSVQGESRDDDEFVEDFISSLSDSLRKGNQELKEKITKLSSKVNILGHKFVEIN